MKKLLTLFLVLILLAPMAVHGDGVKVPKPTSTAETTTSDGGGESEKRVVHRTTNVDLDELLEALRIWSQDKTKAQEYEELRKLLYIPISYQEDYRPPAVRLNYTGGVNISRGEELEIRADVWNYNPEEIRSNLYLWLEAEMPGQEEFELVELQPKIILKNEYGGEYNYSSRTWLNITPFIDLNQVGDVKLRIKVDDQHSTFSTEELNLTLINNLPILTNMTVAPEPARWHDNIKYMTTVADEDGDTLKVTLHVLDELDAERCNITKEVIPPSDLAFSSFEYSIFNEADAGKNFSYYYLFSDGIENITTDVMKGPHLLPTPKIWVEDPKVEASDANYYWWQEYSFSLKVKNPMVEDLKITLYTITPKHPLKMIESKTLGKSEEYVTVNFTGLRPFDVADADQIFSYRYVYTAPDQNSKDFIEATGERINSKIMRYSMYSPVTLANILLIILLTIFGGAMMERRFYRRGGG